MANCGSQGLESNSETWWNGALGQSQRSFNSLRIIARFYRSYGARLDFAGGMIIGAGRSIAPGEINEAAQDTTPSDMPLHRYPVPMLLAKPFRWPYTLSVSLFLLRMPPHSLMQIYKAKSCHIPTQNAMLKSSIHAILLLTSSLLSLLLLPLSCFYFNRSALSHVISTSNQVLTCCCPLLLGRSLSS